MQKMFSSSVKLIRERGQHRKSRSTGNGNCYSVLKKIQRKKMKYLSPSQALLKNQDANVDEIINMTKITAERIRQSKQNNFGIPSVINWEKAFREKKVDKLAHNILNRNKSEQKKEFDVDLFFNDLKWQNLNKKERQRKGIPHSSQPVSPLKGSIRDLCERREINQTRCSPLQQVASKIDIEGPGEDSIIFNLDDELNSPLQKKETPSCISLSLYEDSENEQAQRIMNEKIKSFEEEINNGRHRSKSRVSQKFCKTSADKNDGKPSNFKQNPKVIISTSQELNRKYEKSSKPPLSNHKKRSKLYIPKKTLYMNNMDNSMSFEEDNL
ncbi:unnamed protein product [Moneuplotes crassus]|uniref:Uncharacterized protein n=1 Tax=Euplotes crassus TaxID=5936 RepID=A0AAD1UFH7_EUPCR|nr:unnamed protein product [Moneuplotes crassus]